MAETNYDYSNRKSWIISLDKFTDDNGDDAPSVSGWEPVDPKSTDDTDITLMMIDELIEEVSKIYPEAKAILSRLMDNPKINESLKQVDIKKSNTQAYSYAKKMQKCAKELYEKNYL